MLPKLQRIPSVNIRAVMRTGKRTVADFLQCSVLSQSSLGISRCAIVVSTAVDKRAVTRNRMKRLISESMHGLLPTIPQGIDIVLVVKKGFVYDSQIHADQQVHALLQKVRLVSPS